MEIFAEEVLGWEKHHLCSWAALCILQEEHREVLKMTGISVFDVAVLLCSGSMFPSHQQVTQEHLFHFLAHSMYISIRL